LLPYIPRSLFSLKGAKYRLKVSTPRHNLPVQATPFVGRESELAQIAELLADPDCRLLTLVGPGGSGKTRLALEAAVAQLDTNGYEHGVFFVSLAPLEDVDAIVPTVADALGFRFYGGGPPREQLLSYLRQKNLLLIIDNFEHLLVGAGLVTDILKTAPDVKILATSRARLNVGGEHRFHVGGMNYPREETAVLRQAQDAHRQAHYGEHPPHSTCGSVQVGLWDASQYSAVELFTQSARRARPDFQLSDDNLSGVVDVCRLVEGMPLAVRLAAAWVEMLTPADIAAEIRENLDLLATQRRDVPERQRSMRAAFDHSWNLLSPRERDAVQVFSVFRGGCTREAAKAVVGASPRELLGLVDKSLLDGGDFGRFQMHELLRQYAAARLATDTAVEAGARERHSAFYCTALGAWDADIKGARGRAAFAEIEADLQNVRSAWAWAVAQDRIGQLDRAIEGFGTFYYRRGPHQDAQTALDRAQRHLATGIADGQSGTGDPQRVLVKIVCWQSAFAAALYKTELSQELLDKARALLNSPALKDTDTRVERARLAYWSGTFGWADNPEAARRDLEEGLALYRELGDLWGAGVTQMSLGEKYRALCQYENARKALQESLDSFRAVGCIGFTADVLLELGWLEWDLGAHEEARRYFEQALVISQTEGTIARSSVMLSTRFR
jgi:predicted ATPase